jgi:CheY-like chemotaxis protein
MNGMDREKTALDMARARFMDALPRKSIELKDAIAALAKSPDATRLQEEMLKRLHALYASAQVFHQDILAETVKQPIDCIDRAQDERRPLNQDDIEKLTAFAESMPHLQSDQEHEPSIASGSSQRMELSEPAIPSPGLSTLNDQALSSETTADDIANRVATEIQRGMAESSKIDRDLKIPSGELLALSDKEEDLSNEPLVANLGDKRILVVDDEPAVLSFFTGVLHKAGADVFQAKDGREALEKARTERPDLVISDILMPEVDGLTLCRELKRDVFLADIPVILISWKETDIQRMRELSSGANSYLLKKTGSHDILTCINDALRPRTRLENQIDTGAEVRGRLEGLGVLSLLETIAKKFPDARVTLRDARNLFEIDLRHGNLVELTQTASDGSFLRGEQALRHLLGARSGRYTVVQRSTPVRSSFNEPLQQLLRKTANHLGALLDSLSDTNLMRVEKIAFHQERLESILSVSPKPMEEITAYLGQGNSPRTAIVTGKFSPQYLESVLEDLARRGAIVDVVGPDGVDRVAEVRRIREQSPGAVIHSLLPPAAENGLGAPSQRTVRKNEPVISPKPSVSIKAEQGNRTKEKGPDIRSAIIGSNEVAKRQDASNDSGRKTPTQAEASETKPKIETRMPEETARPEIKAKTEGSQNEEPEPNRSADSIRPSEVNVLEQQSDLALNKKKGFGFILLVVAIAATSLLGWETLGAVRTRSQLERWIRNLSNRSFAQEAKADKRIEEITTIIDNSKTDRIDPTNQNATDNKKGPDDRIVSNEVVGNRGEAKETKENTINGNLGKDGRSYGRLLPFIDGGRHVAVGDDQGLLTIGYNSSRRAPIVKIGKKNYGRAPLDIALTPGRHELVFDRNGETSYRYVVVTAGNTLIVQAP